MPAERFLWCSGNTWSVSSSVYMVLLGSFCALAFLLTVLLACGSQLTLSRLTRRRPKAPVTIGHTHLRKNRPPLPPLNTPLT